MTENEMRRALESAHNRQHGRGRWFGNHEHTQRCIDAGLILVGNDGEPTLSPEGERQLARLKELESTSGDR